MTIPPARIWNLGSVLYNAVGVLKQAEIRVNTMTPQDPHPLLLVRWRNRLLAVLFALAYSLLLQTTDSLSS